MTYLGQFCENNQGHKTSHIWQVRHGDRFPLYQKIVAGRKLRKREQEIGTTICQLRTPSWGHFRLLKQIVLKLNTVITTIYQLDKLEQCRQKNMILLYESSKGAEQTVQANNCRYYSLFLDRPCSYLAQWLPMACWWQRMLKVPGMTLGSNVKVNNIS